ncbi:hypothetical protein AVEN_192745-1 [Araneus ventricosus]|uniref:Uncharacterized protein n=1 Tax=Araneus ventricosus TaxID=182803 RepID=A0A4Y2VMH3_ARAVE|nr:hypothetical protein AVEN_192745-1 [Araneus ventricosus]
MASASVIGEMVSTPSLSMLEAKVEELTKQVQRLSMDLSRHQGHRRGSRERSLTDFSITNHWYHTRFANKARKCVKPCSFSENFKNGRLKMVVQKWLNR